MRIGRRKKVILYFFLGISICFIFSWRLKKYLFQERFFIVKEIIVKSPSLKEMIYKEISSLKGKNIFSINLDTLSKRIMRISPLIKNLKIVRRYPSQLFIEAFIRRPFIQIKFYNEFLVLDKEMRLVSMRLSPSKDAYLVYGIKLSRNKFFSIGEEIKDKRLAVATDLIKKIKKIIPLKNTHYINFFKDKIILVLKSPQIKIILDKKHWEENINRLLILFPEIKKNTDIKLVDLRFKDPVIKKR